MPEQATVAVKCGNVGKAVRVLNTRFFSWGPVRAEPGQDMVTLSGDLRSVGAAVREMESRGLIGRKSREQAFFQLEFWHNPTHHLPLKLSLSGEENERLRELLPLVRAHGAKQGTPLCVGELTDLLQRLLSAGRVSGY